MYTFLFVNEPVYLLSFRTNIPINFIEMKVIFYFVLFLFSKMRGTDYIRLYISRMDQISIMHTRLTGLDIEYDLHF